MNVLVKFSADYFNESEDVNGLAIMSKTEYNHLLEWAKTGDPMDNDDIRHYFSVKEISPEEELIIRTKVFNNPSDETWGRFPWWKDALFDALYEEYVVTQQDDVWEVSLNGLILFTGTYDEAHNFVHAEAEKRMPI